MFELPEAKRVRREDLNEPDESGESESDQDAQIREQLEAQIARSLGLDTGNDLKSSSLPAKQSSSKEQPRLDEKGQCEDTQIEDDGPEEYDFCLFGGAGSAPAKVVLEDDSGPKGKGGIIERRPLSFYLATNISEEQRRRYRVAAVTGDEVHARSRWRSWSMEVPWRVAHITVTKKPGSGIPEAKEDDPGGGKRRRPGKKRRMALRMKERAKKEVEEAAAKQQLDKEEHLKEKKKRLNRAKKLRKRAKEREKKQGAEGGESAAESGDDSNGSS